MVNSPVRRHVGIPRTSHWAGIEAVVGTAPRGQVLSTLSLEPAEDRLARAAFGRHGRICGRAGSMQRISVDAFVNEKALSRVLRAMKGAT